MGRKTILRNFAPVMQILYTAAGNRSISTELLKFRTEKSGKNVGQGKTLIVLINSFNELINSFNELISSFNELISSFNELISSFNELISSFNELISSFNVFISSFNILISSFNVLISSFNILISSFNELINSVNMLPYSRIIPKTRGNLIRNSSFIIQY